MRLHKAIGPTVSRFFRHVKNSIFKHTAASESALPARTLSNRTALQSGSSFVRMRLRRLSLLSPAHFIVPSKNHRIIAGREHRDACVLRLALNPLLRLNAQLLRLRELTEFIEDIPFNRQFDVLVLLHQVPLASHIAHDTLFFVCK